MTPKNNNEKQIPLSSVLSPHGGKKLSAVGKDITYINSLPEDVYSCTKALYLSRNRLVSLDGVEKFTSLQSFSAADNQLHTFESIAALANCSNLENVSLEDNPVTELPNYRFHMIHMLSESIKMLDGRQVTEQERQLSSAMCNLYSTLLSLTIQTACFVHKLGRSIQISRLHKEMHSLSGSPLPFTFSFPGHLYDYGANLSHTEKRLLENAIHQEINHFYRAQQQQQQFSKELTKRGSIWWHSAFVDVLYAQVDAICTLLHLLEKSNAAHSSDDAAADHNSKYVEMFSEIIDNIANLHIDTTTPSTCAILQGSMHELSDTALDIQTKILQTLAATYPAPSSHLYSQIASDDNDGVDLADALASSWSIPAAGTMEDDSTPSSPLTKQRLKNGDGSSPLKKALSRIHDPTDEDHEEEEGEENTPMEKDGLINEFKLNIENLSRENEELKNEISSVQEDASTCRATILVQQQEIGAYKQGMRALRGWLEAATEARTEVEAVLEQERAEHAMEIGALHSDLAKLHVDLDSMGDIRENQQALIADLSDKLESMKHEALDVVVEPVVFSVQVSYEHELNAQRLENEDLRDQLKQSHADNLNLKRQLCLNVASNELRERHALRNALCIWKDLAASKSRLRALEQLISAKHAKRAASTTLRLWKRATTRIQWLKMSEERRNTSLLKQSLATWQDNARASVLIRGLEHAAVAASMLSLSKRAFIGWSRTTALYRQVDAAESPRFEIALTMNRLRHVSAVFFVWQAHSRRVAVADRAKMLLADAHRQTHFMHSALSAWQEASAMQREERIDEKRGSAARKEMVSRHVFQSWRRATWRSAALATAGKEVEMRTDRSLLKNGFFAWQQWTQVCREFKSFQSMRLKCTAMAAWKVGVAMQHADAHKEKKAAAMALQRQRRDCRTILYSWLATTQDAKRAQQRSNRALEAMRRRRQARVFKAWQLATLENAYASLAACISSFQGEIALKNEEIGFLNQQIALKNEEISSLNQHIASLIKNAEQVASETADKDIWMANVRNDLSLVQQERDADRQKSEFSLQEEQKTRHAVEDALRTAQSEMKTALNDFDAAQKRAETRIKELGASKKMAEEACTVLMEDLEKTQSMYDRLKDEHALVSSECAVLRESLELLEDQNSTLHSAHAHTEEEMRKTKDALHALHQNFEDLQGDLALARHKLVVALEAKHIAEEDSKAAMKMSKHLAGMMESISNSLEFEK